MKKLSVILLYSIVMIILASPVYAGKECKRKGHKSKFGHDILNKLEVAVKNQEKLKLSEDQSAKIKNLNDDTRKELIKVKADIDLIDVDIKSKLMDETIDIKAANELIDKKYDLKKKKAKAIIAAHAQFKEILSKEQEKNLKKMTPCKSKHRERGKMKR